MHTLVALEGEEGPGAKETESMTGKSRRQRMCKIKEVRLKEP